MNAREKFCTILASGPLLRGDAIVVLCGEDAEPRLAVAMELLRTGGGQSIVLTGGLDDVPQKLGAERLASSLMGLGISPDRIVVDNQAANTREQAVNTVALAKENGWGRILLVASQYHATRAYLTFLRALQQEQAEHDIHICNVPASHTQWFASPNGLDKTRAELLDGEMQKIDTYTDDVAGYQEGLDYIKYWEGK